jgi:hypothetical protein
MTEDEWLACADPARMLNVPVPPVSQRKRRLFAVACCRRIWHLLPDRQCREAVLIAEDVADGTGELRLLRAAEDAGAYYCDNRDDVPEERLGYFAGGAIFQLGQERLACDFVADAASSAAACGLPATEGARSATSAAKRGESAAQCHVFRDIVGNPLRPVTLDPSWLTITVTALARGMYESRDFSAMPILADALQDAGCNREEVLNHCRGPGPHVRGCWVVDLVLGKG